MFCPFCQIPVNQHQSFELGLPSNLVLRGEDKVDLNLGEWITGERRKWGEASKLTHVSES